MSLDEVLALQPLCQYAKSFVRFASGQAQVVVANQLYLFFSYCEQSQDVPLIRLRADFYQDLRKSRRIRRFILEAFSFIAVEDCVLDSIMKECDDVISNDLRYAATASSQQVRDYLDHTFPVRYHAQPRGEAFQVLSVILLTNTRTENLLCARPELFTALVGAAANGLLAFGKGKEEFDFAFHRDFFSSLIFRFFDAEGYAPITPGFMDVVLACINNITRSAGSDSSE